MHNEELVKAYQNGDNAALEELIKQNEGIIKKICNKYSGINRALEFDDLLQDGRLGLMYAAEHYDASKENAAAFITYAVYFINRFIYSAVNGQTSKNKGNNELYNNAVSLSAPIDEDDATLEDVIKDKSNPYEVVEFKMLISELHNKLDEAMEEELTLMQRNILNFRYGFNGQIPSTLEETGGLMGASKEVIRGSEGAALRRLRRCRYTPVLKEYYEELFGKEEAETFNGVLCKVDREKRYPPGLKA